MSDESPEETTQAKVIDLGTNIAGSVGGSVVGALIAGSLGAVLGGIAGPVLTEMTQRMLGHREKVRIGALYRYIAAKSQDNLDAGMVPRDDGFFDDSGGGGRSDGEEIMEGIVLAAQRENEERKLKYYANLMANIAFEPSIAKADANLLIKLGADLTYRQLCLIAIFDGTRIKSRLRTDDYQAVAAHGIRRPVISVLQEIYELDQMALITSGSFLMGLTCVTPGKMNVEGTGRTLGKLMELNEIPGADLLEVALDILESSSPSEESGK